MHPYSVNLSILNILSQQINTTKGKDLIQNCILSLWSLKGYLQMRVCHTIEFENKKNTMKLKSLFFGWIILTSTKKQWGRMLQSKTDDFLQLLQTTFNHPTTHPPPLPPVPPPVHLFYSLHMFWLFVVAKNIDVCPFCMVKYSLIIKEEEKNCYKKYPFLKQLQKFICLVFAGRPK